MNRTIEDATIRRHHHAHHGQLRGHPGDVLDARDLARRLKTPGGPTPFELICKLRSAEPEPFRLDPTRQRTGPNT